MPEGSQLVLYTDGLVESRDRDIDIGLQQLRRALTQPDRSPQQACDAVLDALLPANPRDDIALLIARTRALDASQVASWDLPADPALVSRSRADATAQLVDWGLEELEFITELIISELVTNAIRYGGEPIQLRLIRDRTYLRGVGRKQHLPPASPGPIHRRGRPRPVHGRSARPALGHPVHGEGQDHLDRTAPAAMRTARARWSVRPGSGPGEGVADPYREPR